ncbi:MAG: tRNA pseudouridine(55) synthase TruB [Ignavibacteriaceae bacterium]|nr:tRNA pseudouridine(55) synthase TruB [Ignavibacteriaceae bacterium]
MKFTNRIITNQTLDLSDADFSEGEIILIDKPSGPTSFQVVSKIRKITGVKKVGHSGTLDPKASGLMIVCTGKKTKEMDRFISFNKTYSGIIRLGLTSPSMDTETECSELPLPEVLDEKKILEARDNFLGEIEQIPPMYSAVKIKGKKLYNLARKGMSIEREPRKVFTERFEIEKIDLPDIHFTITCSKGTYIRVIANDFGKKLDSGGILLELRRTGIGKFRVDDAIKIDLFASLFLTNSASRQGVS